LSLLSIEGSEKNEKDDKIHFSFLKYESMIIIHKTVKVTDYSDMVYDPEYTTGLYQREAQTSWIVTSSSECYI